MANVEGVGLPATSRTPMAGRIMAPNGRGRGRVRHALPRFALVLLFLTFVFSGVSEPNRWAVGTLAPSSAARDAPGSRWAIASSLSAVWRCRRTRQWAKQARKLAGRETTLGMAAAGRDAGPADRPTGLPVYGTIGEDLIVFERAVGELGVSVAEGGAIEAQGLRDGDVMVHAGGADVATIDGLRTALEAPGVPRRQPARAEHRNATTPRTVALNLGSGLQPGTVVVSGVGQGWWVDS